MLVSQLKKIQGSLYNATDANLLQRFDPETLESDSPATFQLFMEQLKGPLSAAHGHHDKKRGEWVNYVCAIGKTSSYTFFAVPDDGKSPARIITKLTNLKPAYIHSFGMTENYIILQLWPMFINPLTLLWEKSVMAAMKWEENSPTRFYVINRNTGEWIASYETPSFFCFHNINAFEQDGNIVMDLCSYKDDTLMQKFTVTNLRDIANVVLPSVSLARYTLEDVATASKDTVRKATLKVLMDSAIELPRINPNCHMKPYKYAYGLQYGSISSFFENILKFNTETGEKVIWSQANCYPAEPIFLPTPGGTTEDDGLLLSIVLDGKGVHSFVLVLDAKTMKELGRASVPHVIPYGFHGNFFNDTMNTDIM